MRYLYFFLGIVSSRLIDDDSAYINISTSNEREAMIKNAENSHRSRLIFFYQNQLNDPHSDLKSGLPLIREASSRCSVIVELGKVNNIGALWAILLGMSENGNPGTEKVYISVIPTFTNSKTLRRTARIAKENNILFVPLPTSDMNLMHYDFILKSIDMFVIDSLHLYCHVYHLLLNYAPRIRKYIVVHDTNGPWAFEDQDTYTGDYSEYPSSYDCDNRRGVLPALKKFLVNNNKEWVLHKHNRESNGLTIIRRLSIEKDAMKNKLAMMKSKIFTDQDIADITI